MEQVWSESPVALRAYAVLTILWPVVAAVAGTGNLYVHLAFVSVSLVVAYFLLRGVRWLWWFSLAGCVLGLLSLATGELGWLLGVGYVVALALLLLPETRRHFFGREQTAAAPTG
ncbi:MAG TPA: hypothetical protein VGC49_09450 [Solirubrobacterales bacterium]